MSLRIVEQQKHGLHFTSRSTTIMALVGSKRRLEHLAGIIAEIDDATLVSLDTAESALREAHRHRCALVVIEHALPAIDGFAVIEGLRRMRGYDHAWIALLTTSHCASSRARALCAGADDMIDVSTDLFELRSKLERLTQTSDGFDCGHRRTRRDADRPGALLRLREEEMLTCLARAVRYRDNDTGDHMMRVAAYSARIAGTLGLPAQYCRDLYIAAPLHDVGKIAIPDAILMKPGQLDAAEYAIVKKHAAIGESILADTSWHLLRLAAEIAGYHHERWDGTGYPHGLVGDEIPLSARIVAVADVFDALTAERPYKRPLSHDEALLHMREQSGKHFEPACVDALVTVLEGDPDRQLAAQARTGARQSG